MPKNVEGDGVVATRINLNTGESIVVDADVETVVGSYKKALSSGGLLEINAQTGIVAVNPDLIVYIETAQSRNGNGNGRTADSSTPNGPRAVPSPRQPA